MSGVVERSDIYKSVEKTLDALIAKNINHILQAGREIRRAEVGEEIAAAEEKRGSRTDEEYAKEAAVRREERARERKREEARKRREDEIDFLRAEEAKHKREIEKLRIQNERRKEREAARAEREKERERLAEERRQRERPKIDYDAEKEKEKEMKKDEEKVKEEEKVQDSGAVPATPAAPPIDNKALEEAALALLLQEGRELAAKDRPLKPEPELSDSEIPHRKPHVSPPKGPAADRNKVPVKPRLGYSSTPLHQGPGTPIAPYQSAGTPRSHSPYRTSAGHRDRSRSPDYPRRPSRSYSYRDEDARAQVDLEHKAIYKAQMHGKRDTEAEALKRLGRSERDDGEDRTRSPSRATEKEHGRDRDRERERSKRYDYDYTHEDSRHPDETPKSRDRERERHRYEEREKPYTRPRREEAPEHIDRYVPGGAVPAREKRRTTLETGVEGDKERHAREDTRDRDRDRDRDRERESNYRDSKRDYHERSSYHDRDRHRDRADYDRDRYRDREHREHREHRERDRDRDRGHEKSRGYERERERDRERDRDRDRDGREERPYTRPRREPAPENIDRYVPGAD